MELIDQFLFGRCSASERADIQKRIDQDAEFARQVREIQALQKASKASSMRSKIDLLTQLETELSLKGGGKPPATRRKFLPLMGLAASFVVLILAANYFFAGNADAQPDQFPYSLPTDLVMRGEESVNSAYQLYELGRYEEAASELYDMAKKDSTELHSLFAARSYILSGNLERAQEMLDQTTRNVEGIKDHLTVNQAMLFLMQGDTSRGLSYMLDQYPDIEHSTALPGDYYRFILAQREK